MKTRNAISHFDLIGTKPRSYAASSSNKGHVMRSKKAHHSPSKPIPPPAQATLFSTPWSVWRRLWLAKITEIWKTALSPDDYDWWATQAALVPFPNYKNVTAVRSAFQFFVWYQFRRFDLHLDNYLTYPTGAGTFPFVYTPPWTPPTLEAPTVISATSPGEFTLRCLNVTPDGIPVLPLSWFRLYPTATGAIPIGYHPWYWTSRADSGTHSQFTYDLRTPFPKIRQATRCALIHCYGTTALSSPTSTDPTSPTTAADGGGSREPWTAPENICDYNASVASALLGEGSGQNFTNQITATNFAWSPTIPGDAVITGIKVQIMGQSADAGNGTQPNTLQLLKAGVPTGTIIYPPRWNGGQTFPWAYQSFGGLGQLWGTTWTGADWNNPLSGFTFSAKVSGYLDTDTAEIAHAKMTIYFTGPGGWFTTPTITHFEWA